MNHSINGQWSYVKREINHSKRKLYNPKHYIKKTLKVRSKIFSIPQEIRLKLGFKLRLTDLLIKPIQRLTKYHMLLEAIVKYSQRAGCTEEAEALSKAFHVMTVVPNQANDMMDIGRLQGFEGKIHNLFCDRGQKESLQ